MKLSMSILATTLWAEADRIRIIGPIGSGKTTFAKLLSRQKQTPFIELDQVVWERRDGGDRRRTEQERVNILDDVLTKQGHWIVEGVHNEPWTKQTMEEADLIVLLLPPYTTRLKRILFRFVKQALRVEEAHYQPSLSMLLKLLRYDANYKHEIKDINASLLPYTDKLLVVKHL